MGHHTTHHLQLALEDRDKAGRERADRGRVLGGFHVKDALVHGLPLVANGFAGHERLEGRKRFLDGRRLARVGVSTFGGERGVGLGVVLGDEEELGLARLHSNDLAQALKAKGVEVNRLHGSLDLGVRVGLDRDSGQAVGVALADRRGLVDRSSGLLVGGTGDAGEREAGEGVAHLCLAGESCFALSEEVILAFVLLLFCVILRGISPLTPLIPFLVGKRLDPRLLLDLNFF